MKPVLRIMAGLLLPFIASCLPRAEEVTLDPLSLVQDLLTTPATTTPTATPGFTVGGTMYGDSPAGLQLLFSGTGCGAAQTVLPVAAGTYQFSGVPDGCLAASVTITAQPGGSFCQIYNNTGLAITGASIANVDVYCFSIDMTSGPLTVYEGTPLSVPVRLTASPGPTPVNVSISSDNTGITTTPVLTFTQTDYGVYQDLVLTNPPDTNTVVESANITATAGTHSSFLVANSYDSTSASTDRFLFVSAGTHNGDLSGDVVLTGASWMEKADSFCSTWGNMPIALIGTGNYRAVLTDGTLRSSTVGSQVNWPIRPNINYYGPDSLLFHTSNLNGIFTLPVANLLTGGGNYWTGIGNTTTWASTNNCLSWSDSSGLQSGSYGIATFNNTSMLNLGSQTCDNPKSLLCAQDLRDRGDGTVSSAYQNVLWQKCEGGQTWAGACSGPVTALTFCDAVDNSCNGGVGTGTLDGGGNSAVYDYCNGLTLAGRSWRVPTVGELQELFRATRIDSSLFPGLSTTNYYMSNTSASSTQSAAVLFAGGTIGTLLKTNLLRVRCISDGM